MNRKASKSIQTLSDTELGSVSGAHRRGCGEEYEYEYDYDKKRRHRHRDCDDYQFKRELPFPT